MKTVFRLCITLVPGCCLSAMAMGQETTGIQRNGEGRQWRAVPNATVTATNSQRIGHYNRSQGEYQIRNCHPPTTLSSVSASGFADASMRESRSNSGGRYR